MSRLRLVELGHRLPQRTGASERAGGRSGVRSSSFHPPAFGVVLCRERDDPSTPLECCLFRRYTRLVVRPPRIVHRRVHDGGNEGSAPLAFAVAGTKKT